MEVDIKELNARIEKESAFVDVLVSGMQKVIVGQKHLVESLLIGLLADGHVLLEGVPGLAKTLAIKTLGQLIDADYSRIQFTPDLLPADVIGTMIYSQKTEEFSIKKGPIFANLVLADEINRAPAKAQVDRFMWKVVVSYPQKDEEKLVIRGNLNKVKPVVTPVLKPEDILNARKVVEDVYMDDKIEKYIVDLVFATRFPEDYKLEHLKEMISCGGSPRASINLALASRAHAFINRRGYVVPEDVQAVAMDVLRHRVALTYEAEANNLSSEAVVAEILNAVEVP
ncbi:MAG: MoxR family ATPase [Paludibacteraceae bacterium]|nr:MoxR family ATPase [Paludibacteraceae bacterium]